MKKTYISLIILAQLILSCSNSNDNSVQQVFPMFKFTHNWDGQNITNVDFNTIQFTNENGDELSIERLRYVISDITFTSESNQVLVINNFNLVDVTNSQNIVYEFASQVPVGTYQVSFTFGLDDEDNAENYVYLNSQSFNVPDMLGGGYHYMQLDGKFINSSMQEQGYNYHAIRAVDNPGANPTFPQDTFFNVNLGTITITEGTEVEVKMNIAEWFKNPHSWDLNVLNQMLMPNSATQIIISENGESVFSLGEVTP
ncbi:hypothetical protein RM697_08005 [Ichthyenterobacterium sp. W332]|uniref:Copper-binding protein MbnP-like domain-containing protein n=1 Tax=Microcosmobacter mediterraneus TaxID=3075607 RepID=A0ABU2YL77_9FLAO|nr:MbnP family protein [Ichthyenterobacterium sp. W332]MDT0558585.1 hypothetical protein [Ichthyenterobacterium sp. W332]